MKRYLILDVKSALKKGYGPLPGAFAVSVKYDDGTGQKWLSTVECEGCIEFHLSNEDIIEVLVADDVTKEVQKVIRSTVIKELDGFALGDYDLLFNEIGKDPENPMVPFVKYMVLLVRCPMDKLQEYIDMAVGRHIDDIDIPDLESLL